ncbi:nesprin-2 isoform X3 [Nerophis ophidion]|uniref:nesprin-2 isoform X3 n=1 Tax=Nerophis ophidion TaxID=159077 RepID=UPI002ADFCB4B|nr:nesprin-2 isoform X3 [Nerophis ophidion]
MSGSDTPPSDAVHHVTTEESRPASVSDPSTSDGRRDQDGDLSGGRDRLESRWLLWHAFMKEHAHVEAWLRLAEQAVGSQSWTRVTYTSAEEELKRFKRLRCEAGSRLVQLDGMTQRNRTLTLLFKGAMRARLLAVARECGQRWDNVNVQLESITGRLQRFVRQWEEFETEREELAFWLAELEVHLTQVQQLAGNTCEKLKQLQSLQQRLCVNSGRVNSLLERGEALIQLSEPCDAQRVESHLLDLLKSCSHVYDDIGRTHTRLLSMRLVFEDDIMLTPPPDSGCPSETLLEGDLPGGPKDLRPPRPSPPSHEHLGLEWDPSVDVGRSVSCSGDSCYFSSCTGGRCQDGEMTSLVTSCLTRRSYIGSLSSDSSNDAVNQEAEPDWDASPLRHSGKAAARHPLSYLATSTPEEKNGASVGFDGRVRAWLGGQSPAPLSCCKAAQTDGQFSTANKLDPLLPGIADSPSCHDNNSRVPNPWPDWTRESQTSSEEEEEKVLRFDEAACRLPKQSSSSRNRGAPWGHPPTPVLARLLLVALLALLASVLWRSTEPSCRRGISRSQRNFHLSYVNGAPPT